MEQIKKEIIFKLFSEAFEGETKDTVKNLHFKAVKNFEKKILSIFEIDNFKEVSTILKKMKDKHECIEPYLFWSQKLLELIEYIQKLFKKHYKIKEKKELN